MNANDKLKFTVGLELEAACPGRQVKFSIPEGWQHKTDHSVVSHSPGYGTGWTGCEVVSPKLTTVGQLIEDVGSVCEKANQFRYEATPSSGLHVHVGFKGIPDLAAKYRLFRFISCYEELFFQMCQPGAQRQSYCKRLSPHHWEGAKNGQGFNPWTGKDGGENPATRGDRYYWFNGCAMSKHGTIEFRIHNGTLEHEVVTEWACLLLAMFDAAVNDKLKLDWNDPAHATAKTLIADLKLNEKTDLVSRLAKSYIIKHS